MRNEQLIDFFLTVVVDFGVNFAVVVTCRLDYEGDVGFEL